MSFNFDEFLQIGKTAAENVSKNNNEVTAVLADLKHSLSTFLGIDIEFDERIEYELPDRFKMVINPFLPKEKTGFRALYITTPGTAAEIELFKLKRSQEVYPITIAMDQNRVVADDQDEFANAVGQLVSNSQFHLHLNSFKRKVDDELKIIDLE